MQTLRLPIRVLDRAPESRADAEGEFLAGLVQTSLADDASPGGTLPVAVVVRRQHTELLDLRMARATGLSMHGLLAGLTRSSPHGRGLPVAVGVAGRLRYRAPEGGTVPVAVAFLEWPDCAWWQWQVLLDPDGSPRAETEIRRGASAGDAMPAGLGRWWSLGRRSGVRVNYGPREAPSGHVEESSLVH